MAGHASSKKAKGKTRHKRAGGGADGKEAPPKKSLGKPHARKKRKGAGKPSRQVLGRQASQELVKLRSVLKEIGTALVDRLDGELAGLALSLDGEALPGETVVLPQPPVLLAMLAEIKALKMKPKKGRVKDLGRVEALLESLSVRMPPGR